MKTRTTRKKSSNYLALQFANRAFMSVITFLLALAIRHWIFWFLFAVNVLILAGWIWALNKEGGK